MHVSRFTLSRVLEKFGFHARVAARKLCITPRQAEQRYQFAGADGDKDEEWWSNVIFCDEKSFRQYFHCFAHYQRFAFYHYLFFSSIECGRKFAYRVNGTRFTHEHVQIYDRSGRKSVPVWGAFCVQGPNSLVHINGSLTSEKYCEILDDELIPMIDRYYSGGPVRFFQDQSPIHRTRIVMD